jgi:hypothetical protein
VVLAGEGRGASDELVEDLADLEDVGVDARLVGELKAVAAGPIVLFGRAVGPGEGEIVVVRALLAGYVDLAGDPADPLGGAEVDELDVIGEALGAGEADDVGGFNVAVG